MAFDAKRYCDDVVNCWAQWVRHVINDFKLLKAFDVAQLANVVVTLKDSTALYARIARHAMPLAAAAWRLASSLLPSPSALLFACNTPCYMPRVRFKFRSTIHAQLVQWILKAVTASIIAKLSLAG